MKYILYILYKCIETMDLHVSVHIDEDVENLILHLGC